MNPESDLNIVLLGKTGVGKSASGNTILGDKDAFESKKTFSSVTKKITDKTAIIFGKQITVCDTPGIFKHEDEIKILCEEKLKSSIPCLFLVVVKIDRFTKDDQQAVESVMNVLGPEGLKRSYMLFTRGDDLNEQLTVKDFICAEEEPESCYLRDVVSDREIFAERFHVFNNKNGGRDQVKELLRKSSHLTTGIPSVCDSREDRRIILLGLAGVGKSTSANTILESHMFNTSCSFGDHTDKCEANSAEVAGRKITVVDTPGIKDTSPGGPTPLSEEDIFNNIIESVKESTPGPHAFVIVVPIGRLRRVDSVLLDLVPKIFGEDALKYAVVLFTHGDKLGNESLNEIIKKDSHVSTFVEKCGGRYCSFDNMTKDVKQQGRKLLDIVDQMVADNGGQYFTSEIFRMAEMCQEKTRNLSLGLPGTDEETTTDVGSAGKGDKSFLRRAWEMFYKFVRELYHEIRHAFRRLFEWLNSEEGDTSKQPLVSPDESDDEPASATTGQLPHMDIFGKFGQ